MASSACDQLMMELKKDDDSDSSGGNSKLMFWPGEKINVKVSGVSVEYTEIESIKVYLIGEEHTDFPRYGPQGKNNIFLFDEKCLPPSPTIKQTKSFDFSIKLPNNTSGTYSSKRGWVKYFITATLFVTTGPQHRVQKEIIVVSSIDFNKALEEIFKRPVTMVTEKEIKPMFNFCVQKITMDIHFPKRAFVLGETTKIVVDIYNWSNRQIKRLEMKLGQTITVKNTPWENAIRHEEEEVLTSKEITGIVPVPLFNKQHYEFFIDIPSTAKIPNLSTCRLFETSYWIKVIATFRNCKVKLEVPVALGHVPLEGLDAGVEFKPLIVDRNFSPATAPELFRSPKYQEGVSTYVPPSQSSSSVDSCVSTRPVPPDSPQELPPTYNPPCMEYIPREPHCYIFPLMQKMSLLSQLKAKSAMFSRSSKQTYDALYPAWSFDGSGTCPRVFKSTPYPESTSSASYQKPLINLDSPESPEYQNPFSGPNQDSQVAFPPNLPFPPPKQVDFSSPILGTS